MTGHAGPHKYVRAIGRITAKNKDSKFIGYYKCALPNCSHYTKAEFILGKHSLCSRCDKIFTLPHATAELINRPHCDACTRVYYKGDKPMRPTKEQLVDDSIAIEDELEV